MLTIEQEDTPLYTSQAISRSSESGTSNNKKKAIAIAAMAVISAIT